MKTEDVAKLMPCIKCMEMERGMVNLAIMGLGETYEYHGQKLGLAVHQLLAHELLPILQALPRRILRRLKK